MGASRVAMRGHLVLEVMGAIVVLGVLAVIGLTAHEGYKRTEQPSPEVAMRAWINKEYPKFEVKGLSCGASHSDGYATCVAMALDTERGDMVRVIAECPAKGVVVESPGCK